MAVWSFWLIERFDWSIFQIGMSVALYGVSARSCSGWSDRCRNRQRSVKSGPANSACCSAFPPISASPSRPMTGSSTSAYLVGALQRLCFSGDAANDVQSDQRRCARRELQGSIASTISLTSIFGPVLMTLVFGAYADKQGFYFPGAPFLYWVQLLMVLVSIAVYTSSR